MRLLVVSNRLPVTVVENEGKLEFKESVGGLASGIKSYIEILKNKGSRDGSWESDRKPLDFIWIGWPGISVDKGMRETLASRLFSELCAYPVFIPENTMDKFYHGFCNKTIWPLFHYFTSHVQYDKDSWEYYREVNQKFCDAVVRLAEPDDIIWIHDYHLMLLPRMIRDAAPGLQIGFFLHIPFPSFEVFRLLPSNWRREILEGLLGADLIGFHTNDYTHYFLRSVQRILGYEHNMGRIIADDHLVEADIFPMGIDYQKFRDHASSPEVEMEKADLKVMFSGRKVVLSIDRLDYTKGIINRLQGYEKFLKKNPEWHGKVTLVLVVVPSRTQVEHYQHMKKQIDETVGRINGRCGRMNWMPILYHYKFMPFNLLVALYSMSDVALVTPLRDGMNLIAKEFIATKTDGRGVLILSEMAGTSKEAWETILINPNDTDEIADALETALKMPEEVQVRCNRAIQARLKRHDVIRWAEYFIQRLIMLQGEQERFNARHMGQSSRTRMKQAFRDAKRRLILLDYDGTLVPLVKHPQMAAPPDDLKLFLGLLGKELGTNVVLISGRNKNELQDWFGGLGLGLVAEHGVWIRESGNDWKMLKPLSNEWKPKILPLMEMYVDRLPGSFIEEKDYSLAWHYRMADPEISSIVAKELVDGLLSFTANIDIQVLQGNKVVEVRNAGLTKGDAGLYWMSKESYDFVLAAGDDWTDEDLFKVLPENAFSFRIGMAQSYAHFNLRNCTEFLDLMRDMTGEQPMLLRKKA